MGWTMILLSGMMFIYAIPKIIKITVATFTTEFAITNRRVIGKVGLFSNKTLEILIPQVESVLIEQNILGKILNYGAITVTGTGGSNETFYALSEPEKIRKNIYQIIEHIQKNA